MSLISVSMSLLPISDFRFPTLRCLCAKLLPFNRQSEIENRQFPLFVPERHQRIHFRRTSRRDVASQKRDGRQQQCDGCERHSVGGPDAVQLTLNKTGADESSDETYCNTDSGQ